MIIEQINDELRAQILAHAAACAPRECCGLLVRIDGVLHYAPADNLAEGREGEDMFILDPRTWAQCEDHGTIEAVVHSHPHASANPSMADRKLCEASELPWVIVGWPSGAMVELVPCGWQAPLKGREFHFGVFDCAALMQDFYLRELDVVLADEPREASFLERPTPMLMREGMARRGFVEVAAPPQVGDVLLMRVLSGAVENHCAVYLGDGLMLHHLAGQLSRLEMWDWAWERRTSVIVRHERFLQAPPVLRPGLIDQLR